MLDFPNPTPAKVYPSPYRADGYSQFQKHNFTKI